MMVSLKLLETVGKTVGVGVSVGQRELFDEGAVPALLHVEAVEAETAGAVTNHQPQTLPYPAERERGERVEAPGLKLTQRERKCSWWRPGRGGLWRMLCPG